MNLFELTSLTLPLGSLNGARGSLRIKLHNRLYAPCSTLLTGSKCGIKEKVFYEYHKALEETHAWPIEVHGYKKSIKELLSLLKKFKYNDPHPDGQSSLDCMNSLKSSIDPRPDRQDPLDFTNSLWFSTEPHPDREDPLDCMDSLKSSIDPHLGLQDQPDCMNSLEFSEVVKDAINHVDAQFDGLCLGKNLVPSLLFSRLTRHRLYVPLDQQRRGRRVLEPPRARHMEGKVSHRA